MVNYIFILGGVISGLGKGVTSASICCILRELGYKVTIKKLDPYLNIDPGTMNPIEHGEVFVTKCGAEVDLDIGHYERIGGIKCDKTNSTSSGKLLFKLLKDERKGTYLGKTIQLIPHFVQEIEDFITYKGKNYDFVICEIGGSAGDYEASYFLETIRRMKISNKYNIMICFLSYIIHYKPSNELKTKPTQVAVKQLMTSGLQPDVIFARTDMSLKLKIKEKISLYTNVKVENIIEALNVSNIYFIPMLYVKEGFINSLKNHFNLKTDKPTFKNWINLKNKILNIKKVVNIGLVGKYVELSDSYFSVLEALKHAGWYLGVNVKIHWINARLKEDLNNKLKIVDGVIVPGGFGNSGIEDIINAISICRINKIPFLGICLGLQLAVIEYARNILGIKNASSAEFGDKKENTLIINEMKEWIDNDGLKKIRELSGDLGGSMRLGDFKAELNLKSLAYKLYEKKNIVLRHRHRYELDIRYKEIFEKSGLLFSGISLDGQLPEIIEIKDHPYFIATQGHPEFQSNPFKPEPLFIGLISNSL